MEVMVKTPAGTIIQIKVNSFDSIVTVKNRVREKDQTYQLDDFNLSYCGHIMIDLQSVADYNIRHESTINMV